MNNVSLSGRLTADPEVRYTSGYNPTAVAKYRLAVERKYKKDGEQNADFIPCVALGKNGEFAEKYLKKGMKIIVEGAIQTGSFTNKEGHKVYTTEVLVNSHEFCESKKSGQSGYQSDRNDNYSSNSADSIPEGFSSYSDDDLPFA